LKQGDKGVNMKRKIGLIFIITICLIFSFSACGSGDKQKTVSIYCYLMNSSKTDCNLWIGHDDKPPADSLVGVGGSKIYTFEVTAKADEPEDLNAGRFRAMTGKVRVNVGKDGTGIMQKVIEVDGNYASSIYISWNGTDFKLTIPE
jgi:hypothetical protein